MKNSKIARRKTRAAITLLLTMFVTILLAPTTLLADPSSPAAAPTSLSDTNPMPLTPAGVIAPSASPAPVPSSLTPQASRAGPDGTSSEDAAPADLPSTAAPNDPLESINRPIFEVNDFLDRLLLRPLAELDRAVIPPPVRERVVDILSNMREPVIFANNLMAGDLDRAGKTVQRFAINTTLGVGGMFDWATDWKIEQQPGDFGETLHEWGLASGPYLVLPLFGPSNVRDAVGVGVDTFISPWQYLAAIGPNSTYDTFELVDFGAAGITKREQNIETIDALKSGSLDYYAEMRSVYTQHRNAQMGMEGMLIPTGTMPH